MNRAKGHISGISFASFFAFLCLSTSFSIVFPTLARSETGIVDAKAAEDQANQSLGKKILNLLQQPDVANKFYGSSDVNSNDGNSFSSNTTYHSYVWDYCMKWISIFKCEKWLEPYVSLHGLTGEQSRLEGLITKVWNGASTTVDQNLARLGDTGGNFSIFEVKAKDGRSIIRGPESAKMGSLATENLSDIRLNQEATQASKQAGDETAQRTLSSLTYDEAAPKGAKGEVMPNMESLRVLASTWTRALRNRLVSVVGEARAAKEGVEFEIGEDRDCAQFLQIAKNSQTQEVPEGVIFDALRSPLTRNKELEQRLQLCLALQNTPINAINPEAISGELKLGDPNEERVDEAKARINIATIDQGGIDPNSVTKPKDLVITQEDATSLLTNYKEGGLTYEEYRASNAEDMQNYNQLLEESEQSLLQASALSGGAIKASNPTRFKIPIGNIDLISLNGLTPQMMQDLQNTAVAQNPIYTQGFGQTTGSAAPVKLEQSASQLTVTNTQ